MTREEFIGKLQMVYVGDRNAFNDIVGVFDELVGRLADGIDYIEKHPTETWWYAKEGKRELVLCQEELLNILEGGDNK